MTPRPAEAEQFVANVRAHGDAGLLLARFLLGRADLLSGDYLTALEDVPWRVAPIGRDTFARAISTELGAVGDELAAGLSLEPEWSIPGRCAYRTSFGTAALLIQVSRGVPEAAEIAGMFSRLREMYGADLAQALGRDVELQFGEWVSAFPSREPELALHDALDALKGRTRARYPALRREYCAGPVLCWDWMDGEPVSEKTSRLWTETILEQISLLAFVDGELDPAAVAISPDGVAIVRRVGRLFAVPIGRGPLLLRYLADTMSGNSSDAARNLLALAGKSRSGRNVRRLLGAMASAQPLVIRRKNDPPSTRVFEANWRALVSLAPSAAPNVPLYLHLVHRALLAAGRGPEDAEPLIDAQAAALGAMLRGSALELAEPATAREWAASAGTLAIEAVRAIEKVTAELRDGTLLRDVEDEGDNRDAELLRRICEIAFCLAVFLAAVREAGVAGEPWAGLLLVAAIFSALGLFWSVFRMG